MRRITRPRTLTFLIVAVLGVGACIISTTTSRVPIEKHGPGKPVFTPLRAHLNDGSLIIFPTGASITAAEVVGAGLRYDPTRSAAPLTLITVSLDSVLALETFERTVNPGRTLIYGTLSLAASAVASAGLALAIFGSCPTIYADSAGTQVLQAESFSNSIAPLLARRDLDRLIARADAKGIVRLDVRNEALETHYIDHLELVEFRHRADETAVPSSPGIAMAVSGFVTPGSVTDAAGRDVRRFVAAQDDAVYSTDDGFLARAIDGGPVEDHLDVTVPRSAIGDTLAIVLRTRSSLLSTSVLYDHMLGRPGASSLDWMAGDLARITTLAKLSSWFANNFAMRVSVRDGDKWKPVARMLNFGPAAWRTIGVIVPVIGDDSVRIRVTFLADEFRIDEIAIARHARMLPPHAIPIARITDSKGFPRNDVAAMLSRADGKNVETHPGDRFHAEFDVGTANPATRTFMVGAEGYYTEWIRASWLRSATDSVPFSPSRTTVRDVLRSWRAGRDSLEQLFFVRRVPVV